MATKNLLVRLGVDMSDLEKATDKAKGHFAKLAQVKKSAADGQRDSLTRELERAQQQVQKLEADYKRLTGNMGQAGTENGLLKQLRDVQKARTDLDKEWTNKDGSLKETTPDDVMQQYDVLEKRANELYDKIRRVRLDPASTQQAQELAAKLDEARQNVEQLQQELEKVPNEKGPGVGTAMLDGLAAAGNGARSLFAGIGNAARSGLGLAATGAKNAAAALGSLLKNAAQGGLQKIESLGSGVGRVAKRIASLAASALVFNVLSKGFQQIQQGIAGMVESDSQLKASLAGIQGNLLTAFAPLWQTILPMVRAVAAALAQLAAIIAQVMAALFGTSVGAAQKSAAAYNKQAKAATSSAGATKKAAAEAKKAQREAMDFDVLHKVKDNDDNSGGGGGGGITPDFSTDLTKTTPFVDQLIDAINADNWYKVGALLADKLNEAMESIPWDKIQQTIHKWALNIADTLNGFVETLDWGLVGSTLGNGLNTALDFMDTFVQNFHWQSLGKGIGDGLESMRQTIDWPTLGRFMTDGLRIAFETLHGFVTSGFNWRGLGDDVATAINSAWNNVDWVQAAGDLGELAKGILEGASNAVQGVDWAKIGQDCAKALKAVDWEGIIDDVFELIGSLIGGVLGAGFSFFTELFDGLDETLNKYFGDVGEKGIDGFYEGIGEMLADVGKWAKEHIVDPFIDGVKAALGIHSPSTVMSDIGKNTIEGFFNGISENWGAVSDWVGEHLGNLIQDFKDWKEETGQKVSEWADNTRETVGTWISDTATNVGSWVSNRKQDFADWASNTAQTVSGWAGTARQTVSDWAGNTAQDVSNWSQGRQQDFANWKAKTGSTLSGWASTARGTISGWSSAAAGLIQNFSTNGQNRVQGFANAAKGFLQSFSSQGAATLQNWAGTAVAAVQSFGNRAKDTVSNAVNSMSQTLQGLASSAWNWGLDFMGNFANAVSSKASDLLQNVQNVAKDIRGYMHFTVPDRGPLADADTWMPDFMDLLAEGVDANAPDLVSRVQNVARQINRAYNETAQPDALRISRSVQVNADPLGQIDNGAGDIITTMRSGFAQIVRAVENKDTDVYMDGDKVEDITAKSRRKRARMYGEA